MINLLIYNTGTMVGSRRLALLLFKSWPPLVNLSGLLSHMTYLEEAINKFMLRVHRFGKKDSNNLYRVCGKILAWIGSSIHPKLHTESMLHTWWALLCQFFCLKDHLQWNIALPNTIRFLNSDKTWAISQNHPRPTAFTWAISSLQQRVV